MHGIPAVRSGARYWIFGALAMTLSWALLPPATGQSAASTLDPTFGSGGTVLVEDDTLQVTAVAVQPDGRILVGGTSSDGPLLRFNPDGSRDRSFTAPYDGHFGLVTGIAVQPDGRIVTAIADRSEFRVVRRHADGSLDTGFGAGGVVVTAIRSETGTIDWDTASDVAVQPDGRIVAVGRSLGPVPRLHRGPPPGPARRRRRRPPLTRCAGRTPHPPARSSAADRRPTAFSGHNAEPQSAAAVPRTRSRVGTRQPTYQTPTIPAATTVARAGGEESPTAALSETASTIMVMAVTLARRGMPWPAR